jgi:hypothetical protein
MSFILVGVYSRFSVRRQMVLRNRLFQRSNKIQRSSAEPNEDETNGNDGNAGQLRPESRLTCHSDASHLTNLVARRDRGFGCRAYFGYTTDTLMVTSPDDGTVMLKCMIKK